MVRVWFLKSDRRSFWCARALLYFWSPLKSLVSYQRASQTDRRSARLVLAAAVMVHGTLFLSEMRSAQGVCAVSFNATRAISSVWLRAMRIMPVRHNNDAILTP